MKGRKRLIISNRRFSECTHTLLVKNGVSVNTQKQDITPLLLCDSFEDITQVSKDVMYKVYLTKTVLQDAFFNSAFSLVL